MLLQNSEDAKQLRRVQELQGSECVSLKNKIIKFSRYIFNIQPEYIAATSARKRCGITVPRGSKSKEVVLQYVVDNVPDVSIIYTKFGNPQAQCYDKADSWVIAKAGYLCTTGKS